MSAKQWYTAETNKRNVLLSQIHIKLKNNLLWSELYAKYGSRLVPQGSKQCTITFEIVQSRQKSLKISKLVKPKKFTKMISVR